MLIVWLQVVVVVGLIVTALVMVVVLLVVRISMVLTQTRLVPLTNRSNLHLKSELCWILLLWEKILILWTDHLIFGLVTRKKVKKLFRKQKLSMAFQMCSNQRKLVMVIIQNMVAIIFIRVITMRQNATTPSMAKP